MPASLLMRYLILFLLLVVAYLAPGRSPGAAEAIDGRQTLPAAAPPPILVLGDSLSAAYHIAPESGWVTLLAQRLKQKNPQRSPHVGNARISGETTAGGLARLP